jgi:peroxiredoxin 2/4
MKPMSFFIGCQVPNFQASAVLAKNSVDQKFNFYDYIQGHYVILFFYPFDFTYVCPTELVALNEALPQLKKLKTRIIGVSVDSVHSHIAWKNQSIQDGGIGRVKFPLISDNTHSISKSFQVYSAAEGCSMRATYLIDDQKIAWNLSINHRPIGRNISESIRQIEAIQFCKKNDSKCPADWKPKDEGLDPNKASLINFFKRKKSA